MSEDCLFCRIVAGEVPATVVYEDDHAFAFRDITPQAPVHVLVIPRAHHANAAAIGEADPALAGAMLAAAGAVAKAEGLAENGYRLILDTGPHALQTVFHVHAHILGGELLGPMLSV